MTCHFTACPPTGSQPSGPRLLGEWPSHAQKAIPFISFHDRPFHYLPTDRLPASCATASRRVALRSTKAGNSTTGMILKVVLREGDAKRGEEGRGRRGFPSGEREAVDWWMERSNDEVMHIVALRPTRREVTDRDDPECGFIGFSDGGGTVERGGRREWHVVMMPRPKVYFTSMQNTEIILMTVPRDAKGGH